MCCCKFWDGRNQNVDELLGQLDSGDCVGALLNTSAESHGFLAAAAIRCLAFCFGENGHWIALRKMTDENATSYVDLDSKHESPQTYSGTRLRDFMTFHMSANTSIMLAKKQSSKTKLG